MWQLATDDVHWVNVVGMHWRGKAEVQKAHQVYFDLRPSLNPGNFGTYRLKQEQLAML